MQPRINYLLNKEDDSLKKRNLRIDMKGVGFCNPFAFVLSLEEEYVSSFTSRDELKALFEDDEDEEPEHNHD